MIGFKNGKYQNVNEMSVPITSLSINRGYGAFEFFQIINGKPFYGERHLARLVNTLKELRIECKFTEQMLEVASELLVKNSLRDCFITIFVLPHNEAVEGLYQGDIYIFPSARPVIEESVFEKGSSLLIRNYQRDMPYAKSTSYLFGQFMKQECDELEALDVLYYNGTTIQETSRGNIFIVKNGCVYTPSLNVLKGITRSIVIDILKENSYLFDEKEITVEELFAADEVFVTSTTKHVMPIIKIQNQIIADAKPGEITLQLVEKFKKLKDNYSK